MSRPAFSAQILSEALGNAGALPSGPGAEARASGDPVCEGRRGDVPVDPTPTGPWLDRPVRLADLGAGERLVVAAFRQWVAEKGAGTRCWDELSRALGPEAAPPVFAALVGLIESLRAVATRRILHHTPCCPCLAADELRLVALVKTAATGRLDRAARQAASLVRAVPMDLPSCDPGVVEVAQCARQLALTLVTAGCAPDRSD